jgi:hypothetical protein
MPAAAARPRRRAAAYAVAAAVAVAAAQATAHLVDTLALDGRFGSLDATSDTSLVGALTPAATAIAATGALVLAVRGRAARVVYAATGLALLFLAVDDLLGLHESLSDAAAGRVALAATDHWPALVLYAPLLAGVAAVLWRLPGGDRDARHAARIGIACLGAALAIRPVAFAVLVGWDYRPGDTGRELAAALQQALELGGWVVVAAGLVVAARRAA